MTTNLASARDAANRLMEIARRLRHADLDGQLVDTNVTIYVGGYFPQHRAADDEAARLATVDQLASLFDQTAARRTRASGLGDAHEMHLDSHGVELRISTFVEPPKQCACGAVCTHETAGVTA